ncbi:MAG: helix-turn-helix domain-containing protein [Paracoccaceae bacterium]
MSDWSAVKATLKAANEAEARLTVGIRHSEKIGALPPNLMSAQRDLYEARRLLTSAISSLNPTKYRGKKPSYSRDAFELIQTLGSEGAGTTATAKAAGVSRQTVLRIKADPSAAEAALARWGL